MIEFGKTLRNAREAKGYSVSQIAEMTRMMHQVVEDLEAENFTRIPAPIYGRGFVKLYCEAVGIDAKPLVEEYMAIQSGAREATIRVRSVDMPPPDPARYETPAPPIPAAAPASPVPAAPEPSPEPSPAIPPIRQTLLDHPVNAPSRDDLFSLPEKKDCPPAPADAVPPRSTPFLLRPETPPGPFPFERPTPDTTGPAASTDTFLPRARREFRLPEMNLPPIPRNTWRIALVICSAALVIWGLIAGVRSLYRATMTPPGAADTAPAAETSEMKPAEAVTEKQKKETVEKPKAEPAPQSTAKTCTAAPSAPTAARTPQKIPPLYID